MNNHSTPLTPPLTLTVNLGICKRLRGATPLTIVNTPKRRFLANFDGCIFSVNGSVNGKVLTENICVNG